MFSRWNVLTSAQCARIRDLLAAVSFSSGRLTAANASNKNNEQTRGGDSAAGAEAAGIVVAALSNSAQLQRSAHPRAFTSPIFARYRKGMCYGQHLDSALIEGVRTDLAVTIGLSDSALYEGGQLTSEADPIGVRPAEGEAIVYQADTLHEVTEVASGERLVAVLWVQSYICDPRQRRLLFEIEEASRRTRDVGVRKVYQNLLRMWAS